MNLSDSTRIYKRTPRGREATKLAYEHLGIKYKGSDDTMSLFD